MTGFPLARAARVLASGSAHGRAAQRRRRGPAARQQHGDQDDELSELDVLRREADRTHGDDGDEQHQRPGRRARPPQQHGEERHQRRGHQRGMHQAELHDAGDPEVLDAVCEPELALQRVGAAIRSAQTGSRSSRDGRAGPAWRRAPGRCPCPRRSAAASCRTSRDRGPRRSRQQPTNRAPIARIRTVSGTRPPRISRNSSNATSRER